MARGTKFVQVATGVLRKLSEEAFKDQNALKTMIVPFFVKFGEVENKEFFDKKLQ